MYSRVLLVTFVTFQLLIAAFGQRQWVPPTTTAAEMWNPYTWYWPYAIAAAEGYRDYFANAQQITNQLYQQAYATNAFWWTGGGGGRPSGQVGGAAGQAGGAVGQAGGAAGGAAGQAGGAAGGAAGQAGGTAGGAAGQAGNQAGQVTNNPTGSQPVPNMSQGGTGWG